MGPISTTYYDCHCHHLLYSEKLAFSTNRKETLPRVKKKGTLNQYQIDIWK